MKKATPYGRRATDGTGDVSVKVKMKMGELDIIRNFDATEVSGCRVSRKVHGMDSYKRFRRLIQVGCIERATRGAKASSFKMDFEAKKSTS